MEHNLRGLFERALDDEPVPPPGDLTREAMAHGRRIRRRRGLFVGGSMAAAVVATTVVLNVALASAEPPAPMSAAASMMARANPTCTWGLKDDVSDVVIFLNDDITESKRFYLDAALRADPLVRDLRFESREEAFAEFKELWASDPDLVRKVTVASLPESLRAKLAEPSEYPAFAAKFQGRAGVKELVGVACPGTTK